MTNPVNTVVAQSSIEMAPVVSGRFTRINTNFKSNVSSVAQRISTLALNAFNSIKETFSNLYTSLKNAVTSLVNRVSALFKKEEVKETVAIAVEPEKVTEEEVVAVPNAPAAWYTAESLKAKVLSVKNALVTFSKEHKTAIIIASLGAIALGTAAYAGCQNFCRVVPETAEAARLAFSKVSYPVCKAVYPESAETAWNAFHRASQGFSQMPKEAVVPALVLDTNKAANTTGPILMFQATKVVNSTRI